MEKNRESDGPLRGLRLPVLGTIPLQPHVFLQQLRLKGEAPLWVQILKFAVCGIITTALFFVFYTLFELYLPEYMSEELETSVRQKNLRLVVLVCFIPANLVAFWMNRALVFHVKKYRISVELMLFLLVAGMGFLGGEIGKVLMVERGYSNISAVLVFAVASAGVNFIARRFIVFGG